MELILLLSAIVLFCSLLAHRKNRIDLVCYKETAFIMMQLPDYGAVSHKTAVNFYLDFDTFLHEHSDCYYNCPGCGYPNVPFFNCNCDDSVAIRTFFSHI